MNGFHIKDVLAYNVKFCWLGVPMKSTKYYSTTNSSDCTVLTISDGKTYFYYFSGWRSTGCEVPDCPSDCNYRGVCNTTGQRPECTNCQEGWMGEDCGTPCNGLQIPMDSGICVCHSGCDHGESCQNTCNRK